MAKFLKILCAVVLLGICHGEARAGSIVVAPTTLSLSSPEAIGVLYLTNQAQEPVAAEIEGFDWSQPNAKSHLQPSNALIISPPIVRIPPGQTQTVRFQAVGAGGTAGQERSFRLLVSELPDPNPASTTGVRILLQFSLPLFVGGVSPPPSALNWDAALEGKDLVVTARNTGTAHVKLSQMTVIDRDGTRRALAGDELGYILSGASHIWKLATSDFGVGETIEVQGRGTDGAQDILARIPIHR